MIGEQTSIETTAIKTGRGRAYGTFGELLQGVLPGDFNFLVTLPVERYSVCTFSTGSKYNNNLMVTPCHKKKSLQLAKNILTLYNLPLAGLVEIQSDLREGKGLASSTADMIATARAIEACYQIEIPVYQLESMIRSIEPSDGIMHQGVVSYYHREVRLKDKIGPCPRLSILAIDEGGVVDTVSFNHKPNPFSEKNKREYEALLDTLTLALETNDINLLGDVTTRSAELNQLLRPKVNLEKMKIIKETIGGAGIVTAHSGTYIGIIISKEDPEYQTKINNGLEELKGQGFDVDIFHSYEEHSENQEGYGEEINHRSNWRNTNHLVASR
ncbi:kinase [Peribacillus simplex]|uniref:GHMP family kinase ATP-binding protein n=1 Tax=Peribacillus simplex TaxID=1478 RepID=UPI000F6375A0|nr:kinase [Peribacillus simplex]RRN69527.1 kinase [Peribacillus simplex]